MSEPQVLSMEQVDEKEARLRQEIKRHEDYAKLVEPPEYQKLHAGEYVDWVIHVKRSTMENLIATVRAKETQLNEALAIIERCLRGWEEAQDFIAKTRIDAVMEG